MVPYRHINTYFGGVIIKNSKIKFLIILSLLSVLILSACNQKEVNADKPKEDEQEKVETKVETSSPDNVENVEKVNVKEVNNEDNELNTSLTLVLDNVIPRDPSIDDSVYGYELNFMMKFINHTDKDIKGFIAETFFYDMFSELVYTLDLKYEWDSIPANDSISFNTAVDLNQFKDADMRFYNLPFKNMTFNYKIKSIIFADGTIR